MSLNYSFSLPGNEPVYVEAVDAVTGEHRRIMYNNPKVIGSGSFGMVFFALLDGEREVAIKKVLQDKRYKVILIFAAHLVIFQLRVSMKFSYSESRAANPT